MSDSKKIEFIGEKVISNQPDLSILDISLSAGLPHYHACGGKARCSTCRVLIHDGMENLSPPNNAELKLKESKNFPDNVRLACQTKVLDGTVALQRIIKDDKDAEIYVYQNGCEKNQSLGEEKTCVLFFLDIRNFTPFIESNLPFDVIHILRRLSFAFRKIINQNEGKIIEAAGDGFYAVFGLEGNVNEASKLAISSASAICKELEEFNQKYLHEFFSLQLNVGIGIHAGKVIIGSNGFAGEDSLSVMGFPVNIAARLEQSTKELNNSIVVSEDAYKLSGLKSHSATEVNVKGVSQPLKVRLIGSQYTS